MSESEPADALQFVQLDENDSGAISELDDAFEGNGWSQIQITDSLSASGGVAYGLKSGGKLVAFSLYSTVLNEADLLNIGVASGERRRGLGSRLLEGGLRALAAHGTTSVHLEVRDSNAAARSLYARFGFEETGRRRDYYPGLDGREDAILMSLPWLDAELSPGM